MKLISTKVKANSWLTTAAEEIRRIQTRWRVPSRKQFSKLLGINERSLAKLYKVPVDDTLQYGTVQQMFSNLMTSVQFEFNTPEDVNIEMQLLAQALANVVRAAFPPKQELVTRPFMRWNTNKDVDFQSSSHLHKRCFMQSVVA